MNTRVEIFSRALKSGRLLFLDGAMGTMLQEAGMPAGESPDRFALERPDIVRDIHSAYLKAGANIITTCTFGANSFKLPPEADAFAINKRLAELAREAALGVENDGLPAFVAGDVGPGGHFAKPLGDVEPEALVAAFETQIKGLAAGGADMIFLETQLDIAEVRAACVAARRVCDLPVVASMTFENGVTLTGSDPAVFARTARNLDVTVIGVNCSLGPDEMLDVVRELLANCEQPVLAQPNAGMPELRDGETVFPLGPEAFAAKTVKFAELGARLLGGCCGTTPAHIRALREAARGFPDGPRKTPALDGATITARSKALWIGAGQPLALIGERINPTGKPALARELQDGAFAEALKLADEQIDAGADALDVNVGAPTADETKILPRLTGLLVARHLAPLSLDSSSPEAIAAALPIYPASCLINSISGETGRMAALAPLCRLYGSPFILLPLTGAQMPETAAERIAILEKLLLEAENFGVPRRLILVDALALTTATSPDGGVACLETIRWCVRQNLPTVVGLSNISFGMPARSLLNGVFLCVARGAGLNACIANPDAPRLRESIDAIAVLEGDAEATRKFVNGYAAWKADAEVSVACRADKPKDLYGAVLAGDREGLEPLLEKALASGVEPFAIINDILIPAITEVGERYERREYFLPQLIRSAETMRAAFDRLTPLLEGDGRSGKKPVIVMATVEGDIHDIGKNIVCLMLGNHGFEIIDAGKNVPAAEIVDLARKHDAFLIGLSALMTTTMTRMEDTIKLLKKLDMPTRVMVGGAAVTRAFAESIGADAYCEDAVSSVKAAQKFLELAFESA